MTTLWLTSAELDTLELSEDDLSLRDIGPYDVVLVAGKVVGHYQFPSQKTYCNLKRRLHDQGRAR